MRAGRIEQLGSPDDVFHRPANRFVAGFMGDAAFLPVRDGRTELGRSPATAVADGALVVVRPHAVARRRRDRGCGTPVTVVAGEFQGPTRSYTLRLPSGALVRATVPHTTVLHVGDEVRAWLRAGRARRRDRRRTMNEAVTSHRP